MIPKDIKLGGWAIDVEEWKEIENVLRKYNIDSVVEFGGGTSSFCISPNVSKHMIYEQHEPTITNINKLNATIIRRDIKARITDDQVKQDLDLIGLKKFDLAFVDGPPAFRDSMLFHGCARFFSVQAAIKMSDMIMMHDTKRKGEQNTIEALIPNWTKVELKSKRGLTLFFKDSEKGIKPIKRSKRVNRLY